MFPINQWNRSAVDVFDSHIGSSFDGEDNLIDGLRLSLHLRGHGAVSLVPAPTCRAVHLRGVSGSIAKTDSLNPAVKADEEANHRNTFTLSRKSRQHRAIDLQG